MQKVLSTVLTVVIATLSIFTAGTILKYGLQNKTNEVTAQQAYYKGVYDTCVHLSAVNGKVTSFDLLQCSEIEQHARANRWYLEESVKP